MKGRGPRAGLCCAAIIALLVVSGGARAGGRRPYGGALEVPVRDFSGLVDPHTVETRSGRLVATLAHGHLFRVGGVGVVPELAAGLGTVAGDVLTVTLGDSARFHDGSPVMAQDVVASFRRIAGLGDQSPVGRLVAALGVSEAGPRMVAIAFPRGTLLDELRALLARPEVAIVKGGQPGVGAGTFRPTTGDGDRRTLVAWEGHAEGRPWLQEVRLVRVSRTAEEGAFRYGDVELAFEALRMTPAGTQSARGGWSSWLLVFHPRYRGSGASGGAGALRGWVQGAALEARLGRFVDGRTVPGEVPWPDALSPVTAGTRGAKAMLAREQMVVSYADGEPDSEELAKAVRDLVRPVTRGEARVLPVRGLDAGDARRAGDPPWDLAVVRWEWAALTASQAAFELARALGLSPPSAAEVLSRRVTEWARGVVQRDEAIALVHAERPVALHAKVRGVSGSGAGILNLPNLVDAYVPGAR